MKKYAVLFFLLALVLSLTGCAENAVLEETYVYEAETQIHSLEIRVGAADFTIQPADAFSVESNLKYLSVSEDDGVLTIIDKKTTGVTYDNPILTVYIPEAFMFEDVRIATGAAKLTADWLAANTVKLQLGAGDVSIANLCAVSNADIEGGAGKITVGSGTIRDLELEMGMGELNLTAVLLGDSDLTFGVGESNITLLGSREDYSIDAEKGIGSITIDGKSAVEYEGGNGQNRVQIEGGVGAIHLKFQESDSKQHQV